MKDQQDLHTVDALPKKRGRPVKDERYGPMDARTRMALYRQRQRRRGVTKQLLLPEKSWDRIEEIASRKGTSVTEILNDLIKAYPMPRK